MNISIFYDHIREASEQSKRSIEEILNKAHSVGISYVDINNATLISEPQLPQLLRRIGMKISSSFEFYNWGDSEYQNDVRLRAQIDNAVANEYSKVLVIPGFLNDAEADALGAILDKISIPSDCSTIPAELDAFMKSNEKIKKMTEMLRIAVAYGKSKGVTVTLEDFDNNHAPYARAMGLLWFMKNVEGLCFTFDTGNFIYSDELMEDGFELLKDYIVHVHCKDRGEEAECTGFQHKKGMAPAAVGEGYIPILPYARKLLDTGYDGCFAIEHYGHRNQEWAILYSAEQLKKA